MVALESVFEAVVQTTLLTDDGYGRTVFACLEVTGVCVDGFGGGGGGFRATGRDVLFHAEVGVFALLDGDGFGAEWADGDPLVLLCGLVSFWADMTFESPVVLATSW